MTLKLLYGGNVKSYQTEPLKNRLFAISCERFGLESSYTTHFEGVIDSYRLNLFLRQSARYTIDLLVLIGCRQISKF